MKLEHQIEIDCPPSVVWIWLDEPERQKQWMKGLVGNELTSGEHGRVGAAFRMRIKEGRRITEMDGELEHFDRPREMRIRLWGGSMKLQKDEGMVVTYTLTELAGDRTRVSYH